MKNRTLAIGIAIASLVLASLACGFDDAKKTATSGAPIEQELPTQSQMKITPTTTLIETSPPPATDKGEGCWALVEPPLNLLRLEDDNRRTFKVTTAEGWMWSVMDWGYGGCQGQTSALVTWTFLPDRATPGQVIPINVTASITGTEVCSPNYDWFTYGGVAFSNFRIPPTGEEVARSRVEYPDGPLESQATYQWTVPESGPEKTWVDYYIQVPGAVYNFHTFEYTWQETGNCTPGERPVTTPFPPAGLTPPTAASPVETPSGVVEEFFKVWSTGVAYNTTTAPTTFTTTNPWFVTELLTYHWNDGQGMPSPGTIGLKAADGTMYGPWPAAGQDGQGGVPNAAWVVHPNIVIPPGDYTVIDSDPGTWSQNGETGGAGMAWGLGIRQDNP